MTKRQIITKIDANANFTGTETFISFFSIEHNISSIKESFH